MTGQAAWARARSDREGREHSTRTDLLSSAADVFASRGYAHTTIADITDAAGVSRASFYLYFTSRSDVFVSVAGSVRDDFLAAHEIPDVDESDPVELGRASSAAFLTAYARHLDLMTVIEHQALADETIAEIWREIQERPRRRVIRYVRRLAEQGDAHPAADAESIAEAVLGMFERFARRRITDPDEFESAVTSLNAMYLRLLGIEQPEPTDGR
ncbi:TetR/AcrR family transcriptional regulator [Gordonia otitidis]|uniref:TetR family transcriptional regulator n=1 Tax=Gordonia otitidis (strain DSM 44809 / CCUG 52243 / JCM 12355 / NBRC 100426 / IFM 10032) TaxID=1108044 RepID=H5TJG6_GORO1|nr:TetR family transcriptional regulator [Gordonia otitidis]UEA58159.1 TetR family transcriptional regulator [Gordonia otitidis]GAB33624.1 putative TetR family transcriptional regulator [Gordonia otitidis NBRC 100426]